LTKVKFVKAEIINNDSPSSAFNSFDVEGKEYEEKKITIVYKK
jgi:hypothetical protein